MSDGVATSDGLPMVWPDIVMTHGDALVLAGSHCPGCGRHDFPADATCRDCETPMRRVPLGRDGRIFSVTTVRTRAPFGLPTPYSVAFVDLDDAPLRLFALIDPAFKDAAIGMPVSLSVRPLGVNSRQEPCLRPVFGRALGAELSS